MKTTLRTLTVILFCLLFINAKKEDQDKEDILIHTQSKTINHGYINFLFFENHSPSLLKVYSYSIDIKKNNFYVSLIESIKVSSNYDTNNYKSTKEWNEKQKNTYREKYFKVIHNNFLTLTNREKFHLIDSIAKNIN